MKLLYNHILLFIFLLYGAMLWIGCCTLEGCVGAIHFEIESKEKNFLEDLYYFELTSGAIHCYWFFSTNQKDNILKYDNKIKFPNKLIHSNGCQNASTIITGEVQDNKIIKINIIIELPYFGEGEERTQTPSPLFIQLKRRESIIASKEFIPYYVLSNPCEFCPYFFGKLSIL